MAYSSYSGNNSPANSKVTIDSDEDQGLPIDNFDKEETQFDTQGDIVSISSTIITDTPRERNSSGEIKFRREIYSPAAFKQQVDTNFSELNNTSEIDVSTFFRQYSRLFYDIPRQGDDSHETLIRESSAFFTNYEDARDAQIDVLEAQISDLTQQLALLNAENLGLQNANDVTTITYGSDLDDVILTWNAPLAQNGLEARIGQLSRNSNQVENLTGTPLETNVNFNNERPELIRDARQAFEKGGSQGIRANENQRKLSEWKADFERRSSGRRKRDLNNILNAIYQLILKDINEG